VARYEFRKLAIPFTMPGYIMAAPPELKTVALTTQNGAPFTVRGIDQGFFTYVTGSDAGPIAVGTSSVDGTKR